MLVFEMDSASGQLYVHGDADGLRSLIREVESVLAEASDPAAVEPAHTHLMTQAWGGTELSDELQGEGELVNHVKIYCWAK
jgi:hypothetical protein